jgi:hypothetical protein
MGHSADAEWPILFTLPMADFLVRGESDISQVPDDPATKYCQGAPSFSALLAQKGGKTISLFSCR